MNKPTFATAVALLLAAASCAPQPTLRQIAATLPTTRVAETQAEKDARMAWWRDARFGMFIHWGLYAVPAGTYHGKQIPHIGEWIMNDASIPVAEYKTYADHFDPEKFNADAIVATAKSAGMKYIVITAKHHDGFAMFHSEASEFNIYDATPFKRDPLKELAIACKKAGIKLGFYYSQNQDWTHPGGRAYVRLGRNDPHWDKPAQDGPFSDYLYKVAVPQVRELLTNYGDVAVLWWDTGKGITPEEGKPLHDLLSLQPNIISNNRLGGNYEGDTETPEQTIPATGFPGGRDWETCMTINDTWGFKSWDTNFKSSTLLLRNLIDIASKGGNYLLNVGPTQEGEIPQPEIDRLKEMGAWLKTNGDAIYGTTASPFPDRPTWGRATQKGDKLYLHVFHWPADGKLFVPLTSKIDRAYVLGTRGYLKTETFPQGTTITLPETAPNSISTTIVVEHAEPLAVGPSPTLSQGNKRILRLEPYTAKILGKGPHIAEDATATIGHWNATKSSIEWTAHVTKPGTYKVTLTYATAPDAATSEALFSAGNTPLTLTLPATTGATDFQPLDAGTLTLAEGLTTFTLQPTKVTGPGTLYLKNITLTRTP